jgi:fatty-acyl-CoA synthase
MADLPYSESIDQPFLMPILRRGIKSPDQMFGAFHEGGEWRVVNQGEFIDRSLCFAALLRHNGVKHGDVVMIILRHGLDAHAAFLGAMIIGAVPSFLPYPSIKQEHELYWSQHEKIISFCKPSLIVVYDDLYAAVADLAKNIGGVRVAAQSMVQEHSALADYSLPSIADVALLQHSSGTTGLKKGVALSYGSICEQLEAYRDALRLRHVSDVRVASWLPLYHDMGLISSFLLPMWHGSPIITLDPFVWLTQTWLFFEAIEKYQATHAWLPNFAFMHLVRTIRGKRVWDLRSLVALVSCSEPCKVEAFDAFLARFAAWGVTPEVLQTCYAMAETVFAVSQSQQGKVARRLEVDKSRISDLSSVVPPSAPDEAQMLLSNGPPLAGCQIGILRDEAFLPERQIGEVCVTAPFMFQVYYKNPEATREAFRDGWYRTGDLGFMDDGEIFIVGRLKDVIIVNGKNLFAHDLEAAVSRVPGVKPGRCVAFGRYVASLGSEQLIVVAERDDTNPEAGAVIRAINHAVLQEVRVACADIRLVEAGWLVKTTSGKASRSQHALKYAEQFAPDGR